MDLLAIPSTKKTLKTKIKLYSDEAKIFHYKEILKVGSNYTCLAVILIDFLLQKDENHYPQAISK